MNPYPFLLNQFWRMRKEVRFSSTQADLYVALLHISNELYWKNPFGITNMALCATIGISENTLNESRNILKQRGLIEFKSSKKRNEATTYTLCHLDLYLKNLGTNNNNNDIEKDLYLKILGTNKGINIGANKGVNLENTDPIIIHNTKTNTKTNTNLDLEAEENFFEKNFTPPPPFEKNEELSEIEFLRKKNLELEEAIKAKLDAEQPKKEKKVAAKKEKSRNILFSESELGEVSAFEKAFLGTKYESLDLPYYFEVISNWAESKGEKRVSWLHFSRNWMSRDMEERKEKRNKAKNKPDFEFTMQNGAISLEELKNVKNGLKNA